MAKKSNTTASKKTSAGIPQPAVAEAPAKPDEKSAVKKPVGVVKKPAVKKTKPKAATAGTESAEKPKAATKSATKFKVRKTAVSAKESAPVEVLIKTDDIALRAYYIAEKRQKFGLPGDSAHDWIEAERQLKAEAKLAAKAPKV